MKTRYQERVIISGRVQGVGFRYFTCNLAKNYAITGYVRNLPGGEVEVVAEGMREDVKAFLSKVCRGPGFAHVSSIKSFVEPPQEQFSNFGVRY